MAITETTVTTDRTRLSYEHLFEAYSREPGQKAKYSVTILVPKSDLATKQRIDNAYNAAIQRGVTTKWGGVMPAKIDSVIHDGDGVRPNGEPFGEECRGHWVFTASSEQPPQVVDSNLNPIINRTDVYSGCYARVCVNFFPYNSNGKRGVGAGLQAVQKIDDGEPLGGKVSVTEAFGAPMPAASPQYQTFTPTPQPAPAPQAAPIAPPTAQQYALQAPAAPQGYPQQAAPTYPQQYPQPTVPAAQPPQFTPQGYSVDPLTGDPIPY